MIEKDKTCLLLTCEIGSTSSTDFFKRGVWIDQKSFPRTSQTNKPCVISYSYFNKIRIRCLISIHASLNSTSLTEVKTESWQSVHHVFVHVRQSGAARKGKERKKRAQADLPGTVSGWGHGPHAPNSYLPACASGNADSPPPPAGRSHWLHRAGPGSGLSRSGALGPEGPPPSSPPCRSPGRARGLAWSSGWAAVSFGAGRDWVMMLPKMVLPKSFHTALNNCFQAGQHAEWSSNLPLLRPGMNVFLLIELMHESWVDERSSRAYLGFFALESASWGSAAGRFSVFTATTEAIQVLWQKQDQPHANSDDYLS